MLDIHGCQPWCTGGDRPGHYVQLGGQAGKVAFLCILKVQLSLPIFGSDGDLQDELRVFGIVGRKVRSSAPALTFTPTCLLPKYPAVCSR